MSPGYYRFQVSENIACGVFDLSAAFIRPDGKMDAVTTLTMQRIEPGLAHPGPFWQLKVDEAQRLLDELWRAGLRPTDQRDHGTTGHVKALEKHADVMEAIACGLLRRDGVEL